MAASPSYGERPQMQGAFRRSFTVPARQLSIHEKAGLDKADAGADILYTHASARIIRFSPPTDSIKSNSKAEVPADTDYPVDTVETLPWRSRSETLAAAGALVIEKVRGSTNFLKCQDVMHAILRNSQCWCVDGESKFVLRVRSFKYYRIELPSMTEDDKAKVEELKKVLPTVLRYERTPCPFIRAFTVDLPEDAITPRRKGQWKRRDSSQSNAPDMETPSLRRTKITRSWSTRNPPTSYPKSGPGSLFEPERGRARDSSPLYRRASLFESSRNSSPASYAPSDDGTDSEHQGSEHDSELAGTIDRSASASPKKENKSKLAEVASQPSEFSTPGSAVDPITNLEVQENHGGGGTGLDKLIEGPKTLDVTSSDEAGPQEAAENREEQDMVEKPLIETRIPLVASKEAKSAKILDRDAELQSSHLPKLQATKHDIKEAVSNSADSETSAIIENSPSNKSASSLSEAPSSDREGRTMADAGAPTSQPTDENKRNFKTQTATHTESRPSDDTKLEAFAGSPDAESEAKSNPNSSSDTGQQEMPTMSTERSVALQPSPLLDEGGQSDLKIRGERNSTSERERTIAATPSSEKFQLHAPAGFAGEKSNQDRLPDEVVSEDETQEDDDALSTASSIDSFHTMASPRYEFSQKDLDAARSSAAAHRGLFPPTTSQHKRDLSDITVTAPNQEQEQTTSTPSQDYEGHRRRNKNQRAFSPLPPPSTIFLGTHIRHDSGSGHMTKAILQKVIVKPIEVAILVVHILARIAGGATVSDLMSGDLFKRPQHTRRISGFADQLNGDKDASDTEDDFGVPVRGRRRNTERRFGTVFDEEEDRHSEGVD